MTEVAQEPVEGGVEPTPEDLQEMADFEPGDEPAAPDVTGEGEPAPEPESTPAKPVEAPPVAAEAPKPAAVAVEPPKPAEQPKPAEAPPQHDPKQLEELRAKTLADFEKRFQMSPEEEDEFNTSPAKYLARARAVDRLENYESTYYAIASQLPRLIATFFQQQQAAVTHETTFYTKWPQLKEAIAKDPKVTEQVAQTIQFVRAQSPNAPTEQVIDTVGKMVTAALGLAPMPPIVPSAPAAPTTRRVVSRKPIVPSGTGAGAAGQPQKNEWEELSAFELPDR